MKISRNLRWGLALPSLAILLVAQMDCSGTKSGSSTASTPLPLTPVVSAPATVTAGAAGLVAYVPGQAGCTYQWTLSGGTITAGQGTNVVTFTAGPSGALSLTCVATNPGGSSPAGAITLQAVDAPFAPAITVASQIQAGSTGNKASVPAEAAGSTYNWSITGGTLTDGQGTTAVTFTAGDVGSLVITCQVNNAAGSASTSGTAAVSVTPAVVPDAPTPTAPAFATALAPGLVAFVPAQDGCTYQWTLSEGTITAGQGTNIITFTAGPAGTTTIQCAEINAAGPSAPGTITLQVVDAPQTPIISAPAQVTTGAAGNAASVPAQAAGSTYQWSILNGTITSGQGTNKIAFTAGAQGTLSLSCAVTNPAGTTSAVGSLDLAVDPSAVPAAPAITAPATVTAGAAGLQASVPAVPGCGYAWSITGGTITAGATANVVTFTAGASGTIGLSCILTNPAGHSQAGTASITAVSTPVTPVITTAGVVAPGSTGNIASVADQGAGISYQWTVSDGSITAGQGSRQIKFTAAGNAASEFITCQAVSTAGLSSAVGSTSVAEAAVPSTPTVTAPAYATAGTTVTAFVPALPGCTYAWTLTGGTVLSGQASNVLTFTAGAPGAMALTCTVNDVAGSATPAAATVTSIAAPATPTIQAPDSVSNYNSGLNASVADQGPNMTYAWTLTGGTITAGQGTPTLTYTSGGPGNIGLTCQVANAAGAVSGTATAAQNVIAGLVTPQIVTAAQVLQGSAGNTATVPAQNPGVTITWGITGGTITRGQGTNSLVWAADPSALAATLTCSLSSTLGSTSPATATVPLLQALGAPTVTLAGQVTSGEVCTASIPSQGQDVTYAWTVTNGTIAAGQGTPQVTLTPASAGTTLTAQVSISNPLSGPFLGAASATILAAPQAEVLSPLAAHPGDTIYPSMTSAAGISHLWTLSGAPAAGSGFDDATRAAPALTLGPATGTLSLTGNAQNAAYVSSTQQVTVNVATDTFVLKDGSLPAMAGGQGATATVLNDGRVLVCGGQFSINGGSATYSSSAMIYDPYAAAWYKTGSMASARAYHSATLLKDGRVLVLGGKTTGQVPYDSEVFDPATGVWTTLGGLLVPRYQHSAALLSDGKVAVASGTSAIGSGTYLDSVEIYDPVAGTSKITNHLVQPRQFAPLVNLSYVVNSSFRNANLAGETLLIAGGQNQPGMTTIQNSAEMGVYANGDITWHQVATPLQQARINHTATLLTAGPNQGQVLLAGSSSSAAIGQTTELFNPNTGYATATTSASGLMTSFSKGLGGSAPSVFGRNLHCATLLQDGHSVLLSGSAVATVEHTSEIWSDSITPTGVCTATTNDMRNGRSYAATALLTAGPNAGKVLTIGGYLSPPPPNERRTGRSSPAPALLPAGPNAGKVLTIGGSLSTVPAYETSAELFDPSAGNGTWSAASGMNYARSKHTATALSNGKVLLAGGLGNFNASALAADATTATQLYDKSVLARCEIYDPATRTYALTGAMAFPRYNHTSTFIPADANHPYDRVLVVGGMSINAGTGTSTALTLTAEIWRSDTNAWTTVASLPTSTAGARQQFTATYLPSNGTVLVTGGKGSSVADSGLFIYTPDTTPAMTKTDPIGPGAWSSAGTMGTARYGHTATYATTSAKPNGLVFLMGGNTTTTTTFTNLVDVYDVAAGTVTAYAASTLARSFHTATLLGSGDTAKILLAGGNYYNGLGASPSATTEFYSVAGTGGVSAGPTLAEPLVYHTATPLQNGKVLFVGGNPQGATLSALDLNAELFDPNANGGAGGFAFTSGSLNFPRAFHTAVGSADGTTVMIHGTYVGVGDDTCETYHQ